MTKAYLVKTKSGSRKVFSTKREAMASLPKNKPLDYEVEVIEDVEMWAIKLNDILAKEQERKRILETHLAAVLKAFPTLLQSNVGLEAQKALENKEVSP